MSKVWSSRLSILIAWKYSLGSKYPLAIKNVCLKTNYWIKKRIYLDFGIVIVHNVIIDISLIFFIDFEEVSDLFSGKFFTLIGSRFVVHHFVELTESFRVVFVWIVRMSYIFKEELRSPWGFFRLSWSFAWWNEKILNNFKL